jgi:hypothetical protein
MASSPSFAGSASLYNRDLLVSIPSKVDEGILLRFFLVQVWLDRFYTGNPLGHTHRSWRVYRVWSFMRLLPVLYLPCRRLPAPVSSQYCFLD